VTPDGTLTSGGAKLNKYLKTIGYSVDPADAHLPRPYTTNVLHCWTGGDGGRDRAPSRDELERCKHWWMAELQVVRPSVLVLLGGAAWKAFASVCNINTGFAAALRDQGVGMAFGRLSVQRFVLPHPTAPYRERAHPFRVQSDLYEEVFERVGQVLGT